MIGYVGYDETELETMLKDAREKTLLFYNRVRDRNNELAHDECEFITTSQRVEKKLLLEIFENIDEALGSMAALKLVKNEEKKD